MSFFLMSFKLLFQTIIYLVLGDAAPPLDWRLILSGHVDELLYDRGVLQQSLPFKEL